MSRVRASHRPYLSKDREREKARDELVWEWRFCDDFQEPARFDVLFDGTSGRVRSTLAQPERFSNPWGRGGRRDWCSR